VKENKAKNSMAERIRQRQYIGGIIVYILNRQGGTNFADFWEVYITLLIQKVNSMRQYIGAVRAKNSILSLLCLFVESMPINKAVASGNGNRILTQKVHVQIANNLRSPQCQTEAELLSSSRPPLFFVTIYL
jgi:hypothetical protein